MPKATEPPSATVAAAAVTANLIRQRVNAILDRHRDISRPAARMKIIADFDALFNEVEPIIGQALTDSIAGSYLGGATTSLDLLPAGIIPPRSPIAPPAKPPDVPALLAPGGDAYRPRVVLESIAAGTKRLAAKEVMSPGEFYNLASNARQTGFTISGDITQRAREQLQSLLINELEGEPSFTGFKRAVQERLGALPIGEAHLEQVFRNTVNTAFSDGKEDILNNPMVADAFPYRLYAPIGDARARKEHIALGRLGLDGTGVYHKDDPTWVRFRPPWDWGCRCKGIALSIRDAARRGVKEAQEWLDTGIEPVHVWVVPPPFAPPASWDRTAFAGAA